MFDLAVARKVDQFDAISLSEMDNVSLMNRTDTKFIVPIGKLPALLDDLLPYYRCLAVEGYRRCDYNTLYFDTPDLQLYHDHQRGRLKRYKIRRRRYVQSNQSFLEVKLKNNKGRTIKNRITQPLLPFVSGYDAGGDFLSRHTPFGPDMLQPVLWVDYTRITLVNRHTAERLTLDLDLTFHMGRKEKKYPTIMVAEVKQESLRHSVFLDLMKEQGIRPGGISKYCLGMMSLYQPIKCNRLKPKWLHFQKIMMQ